MRCSTLQRKQMWGLCSAFSVLYPHAAGFYDILGQKNTGILIHL